MKNLVPVLFLLLTFQAFATGHNEFLQFRLDKGMIFFEGNSLNNLYKFASQQNSTHSFRRNIHGFMDRLDRHCLAKVGAFDTKKFRQSGLDEFAAAVFNPEGPMGWLSFLGSGGYRRGGLALPDHKLVIMDQTHWNQCPNFAKPVLHLHEAMLLSRIDDEAYQYSLGLWWLMTQYEEATDEYRPFPNHQMCMDIKPEIVPIFKEVKNFKEAPSYEVLSEQPYKDRICAEFQEARAGGGVTGTGGGGDCRGIYNKQQLLVLALEFTRKISKGDVTKLRTKILSTRIEIDECLASNAAPRVRFDKKGVLLTIPASPDGDGFRKTLEEIDLL